MAASYLSFSTTSTSSFTNAARHVSALSSKLLGVRFSATSAGVMSTSDRSSSTAANRRWESTSSTKFLHRRKSTSGLMSGPWAETFVMLGQARAPPPPRRLSHLCAMSTNLSVSYSRFRFALFRLGGVRNSGGETDEIPPAAAAAALAPRRTTRGASGVRPRPLARMAAAQLLLGEDGRGYDLARRLEACGAWRAWLGDAAHAALAQHLQTPSTWDAFLFPSSGGGSAAPPPRPLLLLQLRVRALLFDKASAALLPRGAPPAGLNSVNANYLQLHADDIYFSLEDEQEDINQHHMQSRTSFSPSRENTMLSQRHNRYEELPDTWYKQYAEKFRTWHGKFRSGDKDIPKRTSEGMSNYLKVCSVHKRKRAVFMDDQGHNISVPMSENGPSSKNAGDYSNLTDDTFIPEIRFPADCVPESAIPRTSETSRIYKIEVHGVLDNLPAPVSRNTAMLERFGMMPEYYKKGNKYRGKDGSRVEGKSLSQEQAMLMTRKLVARYLANAGFESGTAVCIDVLSEIIIKHISKLGRNLKLLTDSYRKQFSSIELLKMFLQTVGYSNIGPLMEITKTTNRGANYPMQQDAQVQNQNALLHAQQLSRQFAPQMGINTQNLTPQQQQQLLQQQWLRRNQLASPRGPLTMADKNQAMHQQQQQPQQLQQQHQQQLAMSGGQNAQLAQQLAMSGGQNAQLAQQLAMSGGQNAQLAQQLAMSGGQNPQLAQQYKQMPSMSAYGMRMPPVKVEAFHELVSGDSSLKPDSDSNKLMSPK
uniref:Bromodomain associated domain-containing protein n=1 Tax=Oryza nivara TaxID=4536 RepID=A0A0E0GV38_ORYNI